MSYIDRMAVERDELQAKITDADNFIAHNPIFKSLHIHDRYLLEAQSSVMKSYLTILNTRINRAITG